MVELQFLTHTAATLAAAHRNKSRLPSLFHSDHREEIIKHVLLFKELVMPASLHLYCILHIFLDIYFLWCFQKRRPYVTVHCTLGFGTIGVRGTLKFGA